MAPKTDRTKKTAAKPPAKPAATKKATKAATKVAAKSASKPASKSASKTTKSAASGPRSTGSKAAAARKSTAAKTTSSAGRASKSTASASAANQTETLPKPRFSKDNIGYTKDFPLPFVKAAYDALQAERVRLTGQANRLEAEAHQLVEDGEMGDVQFDDEGGEGDTIAVERERDLTLSAQARETVIEIDDALARIQNGTYGYSTMSGKPIPMERLEAIPWSSVLVEEKVGGIGRR